MTIVNKFDYQKLTRIDNPVTGLRHYVCPVTARQLPSVTTILSETADKTALKAWRERVGEKKAQRVMEEASNLGTLVHAHVENHLMGEPRPRGNNLIRLQSARMADKIINEGLPAVTEVWGMEVSMYFPAAYAGTTDLVGLYDGRPTIMDHKTAKKMKSADQIEDYKCQLASYALCHNELYGTDIDQGVIFMVDRELNFQTFIIEGSEFERYRDKFLYRLDEYLTRIDNEDIELRRDHRAAHPA